MTVLTPDALPALQRRTVAILSLGQVLGGIAFGSTVSLGALLAADLSGDDALSGLATASVTLGAAAFAIPLARFAARRGRRLSLTAGNLLALIGVFVVITSAALRVFPLLLVGIVMIGMGNAGNLQSRFAATDLAAPKHRGRDLSIVVWSTTIGGVTGPLLLTPGEALGQAVGMPPLTGSYLFALVAQFAALMLYLVALRPDPLLTALKMAATPSRAAALGASVDRPVSARYAIFAVSGSHAVMASVMAMTPIHLSHMAHGHGGAGEMSEEVTLLVGVTIALHVAGMYGLSPVFGILADRWGRVRVVLLGQAVLAASLGTAIIAGEHAAGVMIALILLGLGWSAATVAGAALLTESSTVEMRPRRQGISDSLMSLTAAVGAAGAGVVLTNFGYGGLSAVALVIVVAISVMSPWGRIRESVPA
ncbi:major facilitator superfamily MFS_1 [Microbacterium esteraromaticum]|uniref:Major facilitator superfamily MFS_1 n=1 Tax=Microbacterium esteraromaticum TaxID=57043 RepID=A0A1R4JMU2_9MICO|nr:MFS transporter [Microbacterium esteraromaticum]SJN33309.1 major facilitator superfamily MFS_1 [Microbacterium esteraromaticum]